MKNTNAGFLLLTLAFACSPGKSPDIQTTPLQASSDSIAPAVNPVPEKPAVSTETPSEMPLELVDKNIAAFSYLTDDGVKVTLSRDHKATIAYEDANGVWEISGNRLLIIVQSDTAYYYASSFTKDVLSLTTNNPFSGKLFGEVRGPDNSYRISLNRIRVSAPFDRDVLLGGWSVAGGSNGFNKENVFSHGEPDCYVSGTFAFDGQNIAVTVRDKNCDGVTYYPPAKVIEASQRIMIIENTHQEREVWMRQN